MTENSDLTYFDMKAIVAAVSDVMSELHPGTVLSYRETTHRILDDGGYSRGIYSLSCDMDVVRPSGKRSKTWNCVVSAAGFLQDRNSRPQVRAKMLNMLTAEGWPDAGSGTEMRLKLTAAGSRTFSGICDRYAGSTEDV